MSYSYLNSLSSYETNHNSISSYANKPIAKKSEEVKSSTDAEKTKEQASTNTSKTTEKTSTKSTSKSSETLESLMEKLNNTTQIAANVFNSLNNSSSSNKNTNNNPFSNFATLATSFNSMKSVAFMRTVKNYYKNLETSSSSSSSNNSSSSEKLQSTQLIDFKDSLKSIQTSENSIKLNINSAKTNKNLNLIKNGNDNDKSYMKDLVNSISSFADNYNSMIDKSSNIESSSVLSNVLSMTKMTRYNATSLNEIGISLGSDNKLTVNKDKLTNADLDKINSLFGENGSFGDYTAHRASSLSSLCISQIKTELTSEKYNTISSYLNTSVSGNYLDSRN